MASEDSTRDSFRQRLLAVFDYDKIPERQRVKHVAMAGKVSLSTARRMLGGSYNIAKSRGPFMFELAKGLNVHWRWIYDGEFEQFDPRTARIQLVMIDGETAVQADLDIGSIASEVKGEPTYCYIGKSMSLSTVILVEQHRRMTAWEKNKNLRFMIRLLNNDSKADRLLEMYSRGQVSRRQIFCMV